MQQIANAGLGNIKARLDALDRDQYVYQFYRIFEILELLPFVLQSS
jgi:hypothetical protein